MSVMQLHLPGHLHSKSSLPTGLQKSAPVARHAPVVDKTQLAQLRLESWLSAQIAKHGTTR